MPEDPTAFEIDFNPTTRRMSGIAVHGNTPFDVPFISQIDDNLWQGGCETGLVLPDFIENLVSLYPWEQYQIKHQPSSVLMVFMYDSEDQEFGQVDGISRWVNECRANGPTLVHCQAGLNRSSLVAARALIRDGMNPEEAVALIRDKRSPACLCNRSFHDWLVAE